MEAAEKGDYDKADKLLKEADDCLLEAHKIQTSIIQAEARGERTEVSVLFVHAQDHLTTAMIFMNQAEEFISFIESDYKSLISYEEVFSGDVLSETVLEKVKSESHTRLYISAINILRILEMNINSDNNKSNYYIKRLISFLKLYPVDLMIGIMKDIKNSYIKLYNEAIENDEFVELYFKSYNSIR